MSKPSEATMRRIEKLVRELLTAGSTPKRRKKTDAIEILHARYVAESEAAR